MQKLFTIFKWFILVSILILSLLFTNYRQSVQNIKLNNITIYDSHDNFLNKKILLKYIQAAIDNLDTGWINFNNIEKLENNKIAKINVRFHLHPSITAVQTMSGNSILIQLNKNNSLVFTSEGNKILLEKSIFLAKNKILNNLCINIAKEIKNNETIMWEIRKSN